MKHEHVPFLPWPLTLIISVAKEWENAWAVCRTCSQILRVTLPVIVVGSPALTSAEPARRGGIRPWTSHRWSPDILKVMTWPCGLLTYMQCCVEHWSVTFKWAIFSFNELLLTNTQFGRSVGRGIISPESDVCSFPAQELAHFFKMG